MGLFRDSSLEYSPGFSVFGVQEEEKVPVGSPDRCRVDSGSDQ